MFLHRAFSVFLGYQPVPTKPGGNKLILDSAVFGLSMAAAIPEKNSDLIVTSRPEAHQGPQLKV